MGMRMKLENGNHPKSLLKELSKCWISEIMCDVTIVMGICSFLTH